MQVGLVHVASFSFRRSFYWLSAFQGPSIQTCHEGLSDRMLADLKKFLLVSYGRVDPTLADESSGKELSELGLLLLILLLAGCRFAQCFELRQVTEDCQIGIRSHVVEVIPASCDRLFERCNGFVNPCLALFRLL